MEHLFKLKKDGKTVGYLKIRGGNILGSVDGKRFTFVTEQNQSRGIYLYQDIGRPFIDYDSAHPFVTKDKNGKDVFSGDKVKSGKRILTIVWDKDCLQWRAGEEDNPHFAPLSQWAISEQFELIEDKE